jgi:putative Holliday junction resolvase
MQILAVDYGTKRIGLATGNESGLAVRAVKTLASEGIKRDAHRLIESAQALGAGKIIVGLPLNMSGEAGPAAHRARKLVAQLKKLSDLPVVLWDERLTSQAANMWMIEQAIKPGQRRPLRDQIAACLILEDYLTHLQRYEAKKTP